VIRYALVCDKQHPFESWFASSDAYERQAKRGLVTCPQCGSSKVEKAIMAPQIARKDRSTHSPAPIETGPAPDAASPDAASPETKTPVAMLSTQEREVRAKLKALRDELVKNAENVGPRFPEEARKMHYGEIEHRSIYGEASPEEAKALHEEGVDFHPLPRLPNERN
jgi:hypothetical protein